MNIVKFYKVEGAGDRLKITTARVRVPARNGRIEDAEREMGRRGFTRRRPHRPHHRPQEQPGHRPPSQQQLRRARQTIRAGSRKAA